MKNFLSEDEIKNLKIQHKCERDRKKCDRIKAVLLSDGGWPPQAIAKVLLLDDETIRRHIRDYQESNKLDIESGGSEEKLTEGQAEELKHHLEENTYTKAVSICIYIKHKYGVSYTVSGITFWLNKHGFTYKKTKGTPAKANIEEQIDYDQRYKKFKKDTPKNEPVFFIDASHPTMATKLGYGWIKKGSDKLIKTTASRTRENLVGAINLQTMQVIVKSYKTVDSNSIINFIANLKSENPKAPVIHIFSDQGPYNKSKAVKEFAKNNAVKIHYIPTYSPNLNPIERLWKVMNEHVRNNKFFSRPKEFRDSISNFFTKTWPTISLSMRSRINDNFQIVNKSKTLGSSF